LYSVVPGFGKSAFAAFACAFAPVMRKLNSVFVIVSSPTIATASEGTLYDPPPQPAATRTMTASSATGR
jgi:hypothetical protein